MKVFTVHSAPILKCILIVIILPYHALKMRNSLHRLDFMLFKCLSASVTAGRSQQLHVYVIKHRNLFWHDKMFFNICSRDNTLSFIISRDTNPSLTQAGQTHPNCNGSYPHCRSGQIQQHGGCVKPADESRWCWSWLWWSTTAIISIWSECNPGPSVSISRSFVTSGRDRIKMKIICRPWGGVSSRYTSHNFDDIQHSLQCGLVQGGNFQKPRTCCCQH